MEICQEETRENKSGNDHTVNAEKPVAVEWSAYDFHQNYDIGNKKEQKPKTGFSGAVFDGFPRKILFEFIDIRFKIKYMIVKLHILI